jgi:hypothetical protein
LGVSAAHRVRTSTTQESLRYGKPAPEVIKQLVGFRDDRRANEEDCQNALGIDAT